MSEQNPPKPFTAQVQVGGRVQIPEALRIVLGINEGDFVEMTVKKVEPPKSESKPATEESKEPTS